MNNYTLRMIFPSCIHEYNFDEFDEKEIVDFCYQQKEINPEGQIKSNRGGWHSHFFNFSGFHTVINRYSSLFRLI